ncbi:gp15 tail sheath stabilizer and completion protein [Delftia phage PhiW-14]|uniref:Gp15 tail sheath stabilizer and completion protein n=1 Tax=Delftia phage PhiW-14 TaxID=665032 RepID=C9DG20_BPW14|nr:gp15 tail sheath stabilizer and completion protein [Delftia phage PhiW-14]ACV50071.1 gp15 tail sheath stabilizer and completion protein [Delftia phage PhiW-14]
MSILFGEKTIVGESQIKKYTGLLGALLSGVKIARKDKRGVVSIVDIPIKYGGANIRNQQLDDSEIKHGMNLPAMSFELTGLMLDDARVTQMRSYPGKISDQAPYSRNVTMTPRPYNFTYELHIRAHTIEEASLICETIVVQFEPTISIPVTDQREAGIERDINFTLEGNPVFQDNYEQSYEENRYVDIILSFTVKGFLYKPAVSMGVVTETAIAFADMEFVETATDKQKTEHINSGSAVTQDKRLSNSQKKVKK